MCILTCMICIFMQFEARATARITLTHKSCPAGFGIVGGIVSGRYVCQCSIDEVVDILDCNETSREILLQVRLSCALHTLNVA